MSPRWQTKPPVVVEDMVSLDAEIDRAIVESSYAQGTVEGAQLVFRQFSGWCTRLGEGLCPLPADPWTVASFLAWMTTEEQDTEGRVVRPAYARATIRYARQGIGFVHRQAGLEDPTADVSVYQVMRGIARISGVRAPRQQDPITYEQLAAMLGVPQPPIPATTLRDQALVLIGNETHAPLSELVHLAPSDVIAEEDHTLHLEGRNSLRCGCRAPLGSLLCPGATVAALLDELTPGAPLLFGIVHQGGPTSPTEECSDTRRIIRAVSSALRGAGCEWKPSRKLPPMEVEALSRVLARLDPVRLRRIRDDAVLLMAWHLALRGGEVGEVQREELRRDPFGWSAMLGRAKGDQLGAGSPLSLLPTREPLCDPVAALDAWVAVRGTASGPVFPPLHGEPRIDGLGITTSTVTDIVRRRSAAAGLSGRFTSHSLRIGFVVSSLRSKAGVADIMTVTRHRDPSMVGYYSQGEVRRKSDAARHVVNRKPVRRS